MQCYTRGNQLPRTTLRSELPAPPVDAYRKRKVFKPEPHKIGRPWCPGGVVMPAPWTHIKRIQYNPVNEIHREENMDEMLEWMNLTNWTCGQDMRSWGSRRSKLSDSHHFSVQSTSRAHYPGHWLAPEPRRNPARYASMGIAPSIYHVLPYLPPERHPLIASREPPSQAAALEDKDRACGRVTVPHYLPDPYPGPQLPAHLNKRPDVKTVERMGLVE